jgi:chemotaxis signal transduction protein
VEPTPRLGKIDRDYISGVGKLDSRLLLLLDLEQLMNENEVSISTIDDAGSSLAAASA